jgi:hypothetical protein
MGWPFVFGFESLRDPTEAGGVALRTPQSISGKMKGGLF